MSQNIDHQSMGNAPYILRIIEAIQSVEKDFPLQYCQCFLIIALRPGLSQKELAQISQIKMPTLSRIIGALSKKRQSGKAFDLIQVQKHPTCKRRKALYLSSKGMRLFNNLIRG